MTYSRKLEGYEFYESLGKPKFILGPMVDQSELAFRLLCLRHGTQLAYAPMLNSRIYTDDATYRETFYTTCEQDRPHIVQFCANDPTALVTAASLIANRGCVAVDLNLGCPQHIAKRGHYGAFLMEDQALIRSLVHSLHNQLALPVTCKIRIFPDPHQTIQYAQMLVDAGAQFLTVHGRTREQKGHKTGLANWDMIKLVREHVKGIPVFANGNIRTLEDVNQCIEYTGVDGVMSAEGLLVNPGLFAGHANSDRGISFAHEYLDLCEEHYTQTGMVRGHLFSFLDNWFSEHVDLRAKLANECKTLLQFRELVRELEFRISHPDDYALKGEVEAAAAEWKRSKQYVPMDSADAISGLNLDLFDL